MPISPIGWLGKQVSGSKDCTAVHSKYAEKHLMVNTGWQRVNAEFIHSLLIYAFWFLQNLIPHQLLRILKDANWKTSGIIIFIYTHTQG